MKRTVAIGSLIFGLCTAGFAEPWRFDLPFPQDSAAARVDVFHRPALTVCQAAYQEMINIRLHPVTQEEAAKIFGPTLDTASDPWGNHIAGMKVGPILDKHPADLVLPIISPGYVVIESAHSGNPNDNHCHTDLHAVGDVGYVEFYYSNDGKRVATSVLYFRTDPGFVALKSPDDFSKRLEWEKAKFEAVKKWLDEHMGKLTDLGVVEIADSSRTRIDLGGKAFCFVEAEVLHIPGATNLWYNLWVRRSFVKPMDREGAQFFPFVSPGDVLGFSVDGRFYRMTAKLVEESSNRHK